MLKVTARITCDGCFEDYQKRRSFYVCETQYEVSVLVAFARNDGWKITRDGNAHDYEALCPSCLRLLEMAQSDNAIEIGHEMTVFEDDGYGGLVTAIYVYNGTEFIPKGGE